MRGLPVLPYPCRHAYKKKVGAQSSVRLRTPLAPPQTRCRIQTPRRAHSAGARSAQIQPWRLMFRQQGGRGGGRGGLAACGASRPARPGLPSPGVAPAPAIPSAGLRKAVDQWPGSFGVLGRPPAAAARGRPHGRPLGVHWQRLRAVDSESPGSGRAWLPRPRRAPDSCRARARAVPAAGHRGRMTRARMEKVHRRNVGFVGVRSSHDAEEPQGPRLGHEEGDGRKDAQRA